MAERASTIAQLFRQQARKYGDRVLLKDKRDKRWRDHSWREIDEAAGRLRTGLAGLGVGPGDRIALLADNGPPWVIVDQAALGLGAIVVPLYTTSGAEETAHILTDSQARLMAVQGDHHLKKILALSSSLPDLEGLIAMHPEPVEQTGADGGRVAVRTIASLSQGDALAPIDGSREDLATFIYTSGTTGPSKGVMLSHGNILSNCEASIEALGMSESDLTLSFLPVAHSFERTAGHYAVMMGGGSIGYAEGLAEIAQNLLEVRPTIVLTVPRLLEVIYSRVMRTVESSSVLRRRLFHAAVAAGKRAAYYRHRGLPLPTHLAAATALFRPLVFARIRGLFGDRLRYLISGGAPLATEIFEFLADAEVPIVEGYGLTEASPVVSVNLHGDTRIGTVGRPLKNLEVALAPDHELLLRGPSIMQGYYRREEETREALDADHWLHTGDVAEISLEGFIRITDRKKEIIVLSGGKNVSPARLENKLVTDPYIGQACVIGDRRKHLAALLVPDFDALGEYARKNGLPADAPGALVEHPQVRALYQGRLREFNKVLSDAEAIAAFTLLAEPFSQENGELTPSLKVRRRVLQQHYRQQIEAMYHD